LNIKKVERFSFSKSQFIRLWTRW